MNRLDSNAIPTLSRTVSGVRLSLTVYRWHSFAM